MSEHEAPSAEKFPDFEDITVDEIKAGLEQENLSTTGLKPELYERLRSYYVNGATEPATEPATDKSLHIPKTYTITTERSYIEVADKFGIENYRELGALNGVHNSRYELAEGDVVVLPEQPSADTDRS